LAARWKSTEPCGSLVVRVLCARQKEQAQARSCVSAGNCEKAQDETKVAAVTAAIRRRRSLVQPYRFGTGTGEFLICKRCGVYIGAIDEAASGTRSVININCLEDRAAFTQQPIPVNRDGEAAGDRLAAARSTFVDGEIH
jgi:hypothetical protein